MKKNAIAEPVARLLRSAGAILVRQKKHLVFRLANGRSVTVAATPSDSRADKNQATDVRKAIGLPRPVPPERRSVERREKPGRAEPEFLAGLTPMAAAFEKSGVLERTLRARIAELETRVEALVASELKLKLDVAGQQRRGRRLAWEVERLSGELAALRATWLVRSIDRVRRILRLRSATAVAVPIDIAPKARLF